MTKNNIQPLIFETAWEVCNQVGGIYTVIRSKVPAMIDSYGNDRYCLIGPYLDDSILAEIDIVKDRDDPISRSVATLKDLGWKVIDAIWLVTGRPRVVLFDISSYDGNLEISKYQLWENFQIRSENAGGEINNAIIFGEMTLAFFRELNERSGTRDIIAHFHEWQASVSMLFVKKHELRRVKTVFTTHATLLGRYLAINSPRYYEHLPYFDVVQESDHFGISFQSAVERFSAEMCDVFTTVSDVTAHECEHILKRKIDVVLPNGLNIKRFLDHHEFQNLHALYKEEIHEFVMAHFFQNYSFDLDNTLYFFTSGRFEYRNKGFDLTLAALEKLNEKLKAEDSPKTVVMFLVTNRPHRGIKANVMESKGVMEEIRQNCKAIEEQVGKRLFRMSTMNEDHRLPDLNEFVEDYWRLRYRRTIQMWKTDDMPSFVTHDLIDNEHDEVLLYLKSSTLDNGPDQKVKVVYHPAFINSSNPLFGIDYGDFVRACHLGVFPSYYEPWGYTPLECMARGIPSVTSDLSGFGDYVLNNYVKPETSGVMVVERKDRDYAWSVNQLALIMHNFTKLSRRERIILRNNTESDSANFDWKELISQYQKAYDMAVTKDETVV